MVIYDSLVQKARELTTKGEYKESNLKLAELPASLLTNSEYQVLQTLVENLTELNTIGMQEQKLVTENAQNDSAQIATTSPSTFVAEFSKWANTDRFYYGQSEQKQFWQTVGSHKRIMMERNILVRQRSKTRQGRC